MADAATALRTSSRSRANMEVLSHRFALPIVSYHRELLAAVKYNVNDEMSLVVQCRGGLRRADGTLNDHVPTIMGR